MMLVRANILAAVLISLLAPGVWGDAPVFPFDVEFLPDGAVLTSPHPVSLTRVEVWRGSEGLLFSETLPARPIARHRLLYRPQRPLEIRCFLASGEQFSMHCPVTALNTPPFGALNMALEVPYTGESDVTCRRVPAPSETRALVAPASEVTAAVLVYLPQNAAPASLTVELDNGIFPARSLSDWHVKETESGLRLSRPFPEGTPGLVVRFLIPLKVAAGAEGREVAVRLKAVPAAPCRDIWNDPDGELWRMTCIARLRVASVAKTAGTIRAGEVLMPTDARGNLDVRRPRDTVSLPSGAMLWMRRLLGFSEQYFDYYAPVAHEAVVFENRSGERVPLAVSMRVATMDDNVPVVGFRAPDYLVGPNGTYTTIADLAPGAKTSVVMPVFVRPDVLLAGRYRTIVEARILGTDTLVARVEHVIDVRSPDVRALVVTAAATLVSIAGLVLFLATSARIFRRFRVSELVLIALFATMTFALAVLPGSLLGPVFSAVAGPFAFLFQGLFFEVVRVLVLVALVVLVPKPGVVTLVSIVRYLLGGLALGGFSPVDLVYLGSSVVLTEGALWIGGVTRGRGILSRPGAGLVSALYVALLVGLANAAVQYATYCLNISLYRLYFADWFIMLAVIVDGFLYAALGAVPGVKLGLRLRRISE